MNQGENPTLKPLLIDEDDYNHTPLHNENIPIEPSPYENNSTNPTPPLPPPQPQPQTTAPVVTSTNGESSKAASYPVVEVTAPATLGPGYTFDIMTDGRVLSIVVPHPGVREGQVFEAQTQAPMDQSQEVLRVPEGFWKDGFFDFFRFGPLHSSLVLSCCCPLVAIGQITSRLGLKWDGEPTNDPDKIKNTFKLFLFLTFLNMFTSSWLSWIFGTYCVLVIARVRSHMRGRYALPPTLAKIIPNDNPRCSFSEDYYVVEDYCLPIVCGPCTISQMSRHTAMYETYEGVYTSATGLPPHVPLMV